MSGVGNYDRALFNVCRNPPLRGIASSHKKDTQPVNNFQDKGPVKMLHARSGMVF